MAYATWLPVEAGTDVWDLIPEAGAALRALCASLFDAGVDAALLERCRARAESLVTGRGGGDDDAVDDATAAALGFVEQYVLDPHGVTDAQALALHGFFSDEQLAALTTAVATFDALARVGAVLGAASGTPASIAVDPT